MIKVCRLLRRRESFPTLLAGKIPASADKTHKSHMALQVSYRKLFLRTVL
jgi:hypothetical protein